MKLKWFSLRRVITYSIPVLIGLTLAIVFVREVKPAKVNCDHPVLLVHLKMLVANSTNPLESMLSEHITGLREIKTLNTDGIINKTKYCSATVEFDDKTQLTVEYTLTRKGRDYFLEMAPIDTLH